MFTHLLKSRANQAMNVATKKPQFFSGAAAATQRSLHTPLGTTRSKDDAFQVRNLNNSETSTRISENIQSVPSDLWPQTAIFNIFHVFYRAKAVSVTTPLLTISTMLSSLVPVVLVSEPPSVSPKLVSRLLASPSSSPPDPIPSLPR